MGMKSSLSAVSYAERIISTANFWSSVFLPGAPRVTKGELCGAMGSQAAGRWGVGP